jgi:WD40 repeat protein
MFLATNDHFKKKNFDFEVLSSHLCIVRCIKTLIGHKESVLCVIFDEKVIISGSIDNAFRIWNVENGKLIKTVNHLKDTVWD